MYTKYNSIIKQNENIIHGVCDCIEKYNKFSKTKIIHVIEMGHMIL